MKCIYFIEATGIGLVLLVTGYLILRHLLGPRLDESD